MKPQEDYFEEFRAKNPQVSEDDIAQLVDEVEKSKAKTSFIQRLSSPAVIIGAILGYAVGSHLPEDALSQIVGSIVSAAAFDGIISGLPTDIEVVKAATRDVEIIFESAVSVLTPEERREAAVYRVAMRNPEIMKLLA